MSDPLVVLRPEELTKLVREALRAELGAERRDVEPLYLRVPDYARRGAISERSAWSLVKRGLPTIGKGRSRRVDVRAADEWLRNRTADVDDAVERDARSRARLAANRAAR